MGESRNLRVWHAARAFIDSVYAATRPFPRSEQFGLTSQLRRSAVSILSNNSEGAGRDSDKEFARFLRIALGSAAEVEALLVVASDQGFLRASQFEVLNGELDDLRRMTSGLIRVVADPRR